MFRKCPGSGPVYEARKAMDLSRPEFEKLSGIGKHSLAYAEQHGQGFYISRLVRQFNRVVPEQFRLPGMFARQHNGTTQQSRSEVRLCAQCGKTFILALSKKPFTTGKFCSHACGMMARRRQIPFECSCGCGEIGTMTPYHEKKSKKHFIDNSHRARYYHRRDLPALKRRADVLGAGMAEAIETGTKFCPKCKTRQSVLNFSPEVRRWDGKKTYCKKCIAAEKRERMARKKGK